MGKGAKPGRGGTSRPNTSSADVDDKDGRHLDFDKSQRFGLDSESLEAIRTMIRSELKDSLVTLKKEVEELRSTTNTMHNIIVAQQQQLERIEIEKRSCNIVVSGLPESGPDVVTIDRLLENIRKKCPEPPVRFNVVKASRVGKSLNGKPKLLIMSLANREDRTMILKHSKCLRDDPTTASTYLSPDLPELTRKENSRLHFAAKQLRSERPNANIQLKSGKLFLDGDEHDHFDLQNQLFRE